MIEVASFTVGPVQENSYLVRKQGADSAVIFDPGDEADRLLAGIEQLGVRLEAILLTHTHFDHVGAVAPLAKATGAEVWCPELERDVLLDIQRWVPWPGFGPFENWDPEHTVRGGERLTIAGLDFEVVFTPGHSPGHVTWSLAEEQTLFSGDVLFQGSIGRTDLPFGDHQTLLRSIAGLLDAFPDETVVHPGHMGITTLGAERATNPFLQDLVA
ncbi:MBL fold metallo-hydrolase [Conexibacter sp. JD483]|uniref:MBL fold metallo-hydrolase n=1 Tax=unclassified Conexibacter TaxID=2627773 RepID=UPI00271A2609|nr:MULTISPECIES: MBL fold metallo-hydrolase [unclassified Conexibacter]MDO8185035.1 MBL fold metallo-hydrolase [Conexibacter sp. CPCC 205706]MDO8196745.1 MBL fold metallo-hydrolase [Conexibacter sp. CPCC 205762]MDR9367993.1 MBL fold metallo-hydrolase [Conexibacter sp. JD483]